MEATSENLNKVAVNNGLILGIITTVIGIATYYVSPAMMGSIMYGLGIFAIAIILYIVFILDMRKKIGGYWTFREALKGIFIMALISGIVSMLVNYVFYKFIEPDAFQKISEYVGASLSTTYSKMGMDQDQIDKMLVEVNTRMKAQFDPTISDLFKNLGVQVIFHFVMSLIFAAIFKKNPPLFTPVEE